MPIPSRRPLLDTSKKYLLRDLFQGDAAAGTLNGTPASGGPGTRTVVDTENKLSVVGGVLSFAGGKASPTWGDPGLWYGAVERVAGRVLIVRFNRSSSQYLQLGFDSKQTPGEITDSVLYFGPTTEIKTTGGAVMLGTFASATEYVCALVARSIGSYLFIKGGAFTNWTLLWGGGVDNTATLYPAIVGYNAVFTADIRIPAQLWLPSPLASDGFSAAATDGLGHAEQNGGNGLAWTGATWTVAAGAVTNTPTLGGEKITNGNFAAWTADNPDGWILVGSETATKKVTENPAGQCEIIGDNTGAIGIQQNVLVTDVWSQILTNVITVGSGSIILDEGFTGAIGSYTSTGSKVLVRRSGVGTDGNLAFYASNTFDVTIDDVSVRALTLSTLFRSLAVSTPDVLAEAAVTLTAGTQAGLVLNLDDAATPANFVIAYHNGTNCLLEKCVAGVYATVISAAATYSAGAVLRVIKDGTAYRLYYNNALVGTGTISDAGIVSNARHGIFSTYASNSFDNLTIWARGNGNEYSALDSF